MMMDMEQLPSSEAHLSREISTAIRAAGSRAEVLASRHGISTATLRRASADAGLLSFPEFAAVTRAFGVDAVAVIRTALGGTP